MIRKKVLIVDDSESICAALGSVLEVHGYDVVSAPDGERGVRAAREHRPDLILLDIMMPVLDGWGALQELKGSAETAPIPVIALTALRLSEERVEAAGFSGYLSKPVTPHALREEIQRALHRPEGGSNG